MDRKLGAALGAEGSLADAWVYLAGPGTASIAAGRRWRSVFAERSEA